MLLFLFEHEERKLYGVFEATSDGALNILPDACASLCKLRPAQVSMLLLLAFFSWFYQSSASCSLAGPIIHCFMLPFYESFFCESLT